MKDSQSGITAKYFYDFVNRLERYTRSGAGITLDVGYTYDSENRLTRREALIHQYTRTSTYSYDDDNRVTASSTANSSTAYTYDSFGRLGTRVNSHGENTVLSTTLGYRVVGTGSTGQVSSLTLDAAGYDKTLSYTYSVNGNILSVSMGGKTTSYVYDTAGQLLRENNQAAGKTWVWTYDDGGNILSRKEYAYTTGTLGAVLDTVDYTYGNSNWGDQLTAYDGQAITYDTIGNPLDDGTWEYTWEHGRQLKSMKSGSTTWTYGYDADGMRYSRSNGTTTWQYIYIGDQLAYCEEKVGTQVVNQIYFQYDANGTPVSMQYSGTYYYYVTNLQGDVIALLDASGNTVTEYTYDAWGKVLTITGSKASTVGAVNPLRYRGYVYDSETGLYYLQSRYYDPEIGRFINADSAVATGQGIVGNNMYSYCLNNPGNGSDPCGTCFHRWDFWNDCEKCKGKTLSEQMGILSDELADWAYSVYFDLTEWHFEKRIAANGTHPSYNEVISSEEWRQLLRGESLYHIDDVGNDELKFVTADGREAVFNGDTYEPMTDPRYMATYNYVPLKKLPDDPALSDYTSWAWSYVGHAVLDVLPYELLLRCNTREQFEEKFERAFG